MPIEPFIPPEDEYEDKPELPMRDSGAVDETPNATDPVAMAEIKQKKKLFAYQAAEFWKKVFSDDIGRRVMWEILSSLHTFETRFACTPAGFPCTESTWFHAGEQAFGERLYHTFLKHDFEGTHMMLKEHHPDFIPPKPLRRAKKED